LQKILKKYEFEFLEFYYKREVSEFATNGQVGKVMLSFDPDASDGPPSTKQNVEDSDPHVDGMPCENIILVVPPRMLKTLNDAHYVRPAGLPGGNDIKTFDVGNLFVSTQGIVNNVEIGELHVRYRVRLSIPVLPNSVAAPANNSVSMFQSTSAQTFTTAVATTSLNATATTNGLNVVNTAGSMVPPIGNYLVTWEGTFVDSSSEAFAIVNDFKKNTVSTLISNNRFLSVTSLGANQAVSLSGTAFVSANGTDAFTHTITLTGAAGTLTGSTTVVWTAV